MNPFRITLHKFSNYTGYYPNQTQRNCNNPSVWMISGLFKRLDYFIKSTWELITYIQGIEKLVA
jgi:hypothetical protein